MSLAATIPDGTAGEEGEWIARLSESPLPVLERTLLELRRMERDQDSVTATRISDVVLRDPMMALRLLRHMQECHGKTRSAEITTVSHALMMLGVTPFFRLVSRMETLERRLAGDMIALENALAVCSRAHHAALYARAWAVARDDLEVDEVAVAALLHDLAELVLWSIAPQVARRVDDRQRGSRGLHSAEAQQAEMGTTFARLQPGLVREWRLPSLFLDLMDDTHAYKPRVQCVAVAARLARRSAECWDDSALAEDYAVVARLTDSSPQAARDRIVKTALLAARDWRWYGVRPAAAGLAVAAGQSRKPE